MATIDVTTIKVEKVIEVEEKVYNLQLTEEEIALVRVSLYDTYGGRVGSDPRYKLGSGIRMAIRKATGKGIIDHRLIVDSLK